MADLRRDFSLPDEDIQFLDGLTLPWEAIQEGGSRAVVLRGFLLPTTFRPEQVDLKIKIPADYTSGAALDMFFTSQHVTRTDGVEIKALTQSNHFAGQIWWQWSRHYPRNTPWRPGTNNLGTHISYVQHILDQEARGKVWA